MNSNSTAAYLEALKRFWWVCALGVVAALVDAFLMVYSISLSTLKLSHRARPAYTASALLLVNSTSNPYLRTAVTTPTQPTTTTTPTQGALGSSTFGSAASQAATRAAAVAHAPDTHTLVEAANLFPLLIQSDQITRRRIQMFGHRITGTVTAKALYSFVTPSRFKPSSFPVIEVQATAAGPKEAKRLAQQTTAAFTNWLVTSQNSGRVPLSERILVQEIQSPQHAISSGGTKKSLPLAVGAVVLVMFLGLAILLDRMRPRVPASGRVESRSAAVA